jgi:hypothetical protein
MHGKLLRGAKIELHTVSCLVKSPHGFPLIEILSRKPHWKLERPEPRWILIGHVDAERLRLVPRPNKLLALIVDTPRRVQMIGVTSGPDAMLP